MRRLLLLSVGSLAGCHYPPADHPAARPPPPPAYVSRADLYARGPAYSPANCGTPDQPKPCTPPRRAPPQYHPASPQYYPPPQYYPASPQ